MISLQSELYNDNLVNVEEIRKIIDHLRSEMNVPAKEIDHELICAFSLDYNRIPTLAPLLSNSTLSKDQFVHMDDDILEKLSANGVSLSFTPTNINYLKPEPKSAKLLQAIDDDNLDAIKDAIDSNMITINSLFQAFNELFQYSVIPLLLYTIQRNAIRCFNYLMINGADLNAKTTPINPLSTKKWDAMGMAGAVGNLKIIQELENKGCKITSSCIEGLSMFHHNNLLKWALEKGAKEHQDLFEIGLKASCLYNNLEGIKLSLIGKTEEEKSQLFKKRELLLAAVSKGHLGIVRFLVENGTNIDCKNDSGQTPLALATRSGRNEIVQYLLSKGANPEVAGCLAMTPIMTAARKGNMESMRMFLEQAPNLKTMANFGMTPLHEANTNRNFPMVKQLIEAGANVDEKDIYGFTSLMTACKYQSIDIVEYLIQKGANIEAKTLMNETALMIAASKSCLPIVKSLVEKGAPIDVRNSDGDTALLLACKKGSLSVVQYLVENGANLNIKNKEGNTPLEAAENKCHMDIVQYLSSFNAD